MFKFWILVFLSLISIKSWALLDFDKPANMLCSQITAQPQFNSTDFFAGQFLSQTYYQSVVDILKNIYQEDGSCTHYTFHNVDSTSVHVKFFTSTTSFLFQIVLNPNNLISNLQFKGRTDPKIQIINEATLNTALNVFDGIKSVTLVDLDSKKKFLDISSQQKMSLGSEFKLYVLNYLSQKILDSEHNWSDKLKIKNESKSLPSGNMYQLAEGAEYTIKYFAANMIAVSDNTATDHLIDFLGSENIFNSMNGLNSFVDLNDPFMKTMDMFRLKSMSEADINSYLSLNSNDKKDYLRNLTQKISWQQAALNLKSWNRPRNILDIEWFASTEDICNVIAEIKNKAFQNKTIFDILSYNVPLIDIDDNLYFEYAGYKGGSEPGVLTMTYLLKTKSQKWACLSMAINNPNENINQDSVFDLYQAILIYSGKILN